MIAGIGIDLVDIDAFRDQLADPASSFVDGTFTLNEQEACQERPGRDPARHLGARFAAKEAFIKAWSGSNWSQEPALKHIDMREVEVVQDHHRRPRLKLHGRVAQALEKLGPHQLHVSLTHDGSSAGAVVVLETMA